MGEKDDKNDVDEENSFLDPRFDWFEERVLKQLKLKADKWRKMYTIKENLYVMSYACQKYNSTSSFTWTCIYE